MQAKYIYLVTYFWLRKWICSMKSNDWNYGLVNNSYCWDKQRGWKCNCLLDLPIFNPVQKREKWTIISLLDLVWFVFPHFLCSLSFRFVRNMYYRIKQSGVWLRALWLLNPIGLLRYYPVKAFFVELSLKWSKYSSAKICVIE